jgi:hypothetical protein
VLGSYTVTLTVCGPERTDTDIRAWFITVTPLVPTDQPVSGDFDGDVDLIDLAGFQRCFTGPGPAKLAPCCQMFDHKPDVDMDLADFLAFGCVFSGP